jgi:hypothetical protein
VGERGPILLQDINYLDEMAHFDRERIPERVVHAKGAGAFGYFEVTHDITKYCGAKVFEKVGKRTVSYYSNNLFIVCCLIFINLLFYSPLPFVSQLLVSFN